MAALEKVYANQEEIEPSHRWTDHIKRLLLRLGPDLMDTLQDGVEP